MCFVACVCREPRGYLFESRWHAPAAGLHDAVIAAHVLTNLSVLFTPLLSAGQQCRVTEERRNTVTGQSGSGREGKRRRKQSVSSLASEQQETKRRDEAEGKATAVQLVELVKQSLHLTPAKQSSHLIEQ